jgi:glycosyltransferase involved in cell wall biosynthesis
MNADRTVNGRGGAADGLRVLVVHNRYQQAGGEDVAFELESELLRRAGHAVETLVMDNDSIPEHASIAGRARLAAETVWSRRSARIIGNAVRSWQPDVMHAHNTFPLWSPAIFSAARAAGAATVMTLHNYRLVCPAADLYRAGRPCEDCVGRAIPWPSVIHSCYRGSRLETTAVAAMLVVNRARRTWQKDVDAFVALTEFERSLMIAGGMPRAKIHIKPNFVDPDPRPGTDARSGFLFAGRLSEEKGVKTLIAASRSLAAAGVEIRVAGTGPMEGELHAAVAGGLPLRIVGQIARAELMNEMRRSEAVIVPSECYESFGLVAVEAFATATPVIASNIGSLGELVSPTRGLSFKAGDAEALASAISWAADNASEMRQRGANARKEYEARYTAAANLDQLDRVYGHAISRFRKAGDRPAHAR